MFSNNVQQLSKEESTKLYLTTRFTNFLDIVETKNVDKLSDAVIEKLLGEITNDPSIVETELNWYGYAVKVLETDKTPIFYSRNFLKNKINPVPTDFVNHREEIEEEFKKFVDDFVRADGDINNFPSDDFFVRKLSLKLGIENNDALFYSLPKDEVKEKAYNDVFFTYFRG